MNKKNKGRYRDNGATPKTTHKQNHNAADPFAGWFGIAKPSRLKQRKTRPTKQNGGGYER